MKSLLVTYLIVTGIGAAIVVAMPSLIALGYWFLIIPGLILSALPMAFLFGALFALTWFPLQGIIGEWPAAGVSLLLAIAVLYLAPVPGNRITQARYDAEVADEMVPSGPIALAGHIRIDSVSATRLKRAEEARKEQARGGPIAPSRYDHCTSLCAALLFTDGVKSVTHNRTFTGERDLFGRTAATYALVDRARCAETILPAGQHDGIFPFGGNIRKLLEYWNLRLATDRCIVRIPTRQQHDLRIVTSGVSVPLETEKAYLMRNPIVPRSIRVQRVEIFGPDGGTLLRQTRAQGRVLFQPLLYLPGGDPMNPRFRWKFREIRDPASGRENLTIQALVAHAGLDLSIDEAALTRGIRTRLAEIVSDPSIAIDKSGIDLVPTYFESLRDTGPAPDDMDLIIRLIADGRFTRYAGLDQLARKLGADAVRLRGPIVDRLLLAEFGSYQELDELDRVLEGLPPGTFAQLMPNEAQLLRDPVRRTLARGLIRRQADRGAEAAPMLVALIPEQLERKKQGNPYRSHAPDLWTPIHAAIDALTRIGPEASGVLASVEQLARDGVVDQALRESDAWTLMLMRLGKPVEEIPVPAKPSVTKQDHHARLRANLERYEQDLQKRR